MTVFFTHSQLFLYIAQIIILATILSPIETIICHCSIGGRVKTDLVPELLSALVPIPVGRQAYFYNCLGFSTLWEKIEVG